MKVSIVSPEKKVWQGEAELVIARSPEGEFGIMKGHIPFLAALVPGLVTIVSGATREAFQVSGGFLEASGPADDYHVIVLADDAEPAAPASAAG
ncbi:MAG TPA: ATP synthase F1 subunit epsilon [Actinomycetota bacterium]|nr:ATP synthase F1 subunit epsilon [Actinomycetota bacterium]